MKKMVLVVDNKSELNWLSRLAIRILKLQGFIKQKEDVEIENVSLNYGTYSEADMKYAFNVGGYVSSTGVDPWKAWDENKDKLLK